MRMRNQSDRRIYCKRSKIFEPIIERQKIETDEMRQGWRNETVAQRLESVSETYDLCDGKVSKAPLEV